jgi:hypothetical protein
MFLSKTIEDILKNKRGKTEIIVHLDGKWANPGIPDHPDLTIIYSPEPIGQRAGTNKACRLSRAKYVMKADAHLAFDEGFDVKLMEAITDDMTIVPMMKNLHVFDWVCIGKSEKLGVPYWDAPYDMPRGCGFRIYQGPTPEKCQKCDGNMERQLLWIAKDSPKSTSFLFDTTMHFQYFAQFKKRPEGKGDLTETMSLQGSCFMLTRKKYWELDICEENYGSWGQQGTEVACKTWFSGGRVMCLQTTWYAHMFRTQGGDFSFPYPQSQRQIEKAREYSRKQFKEGGWSKTIPGRGIDWLLQKFYPVPYWHDGKETPKKKHEAPVALKKGIIFYTDNKVNLKIAHAVQDNLRRTGLSIVSASLKPMPNFGKNVHLKLERGYLTMFKQQLAALEASDADIIYMCEHDVLYHPSHFEFTPPKKDVFYYNVNVWKVDAYRDHALAVDECRQVSGLVAYREFLIEEYKRRIKRVEEAGEFKRGWGFEPGTKSIERGGFSDFTAENFKSTYPNLDIRADHNLTPNRWNKEQFRNQQNTIGWIERPISYFLMNGWHRKDLKFLHFSS